MQFEVRHRKVPVIGDYGVCGALHPMLELCFG